MKEIIDLLLVNHLFYNDTATPEIYTLSLTTLFRSIAAEYFKDETIPVEVKITSLPNGNGASSKPKPGPVKPDRKSTRLNSSHTVISYAVFCLKKKTIRKSRTQCSFAADATNIYLSR